MNDLRYIADRFAQALEKGSRSEIEDLYAPDAVVWHNTTGVEQTRETAVETGANLARVIPQFRYTNVRRHYFPGGYVEQHDVCGLDAAGLPFAAPVCFVVLIKDSKITRVDEYFDSAHDPRDSREK